MPPAIQSRVCLVATAPGSSLRSVPKRIPPFRLEAHPLTPETESAAGFEWASPEVGTRHRIGGEPDGASEPDYPRCRSCRAPITFYGQLDSIGDDIALADVGVGQVFVCLDYSGAACHSPSSVDLPHPAGAHTTVDLRSRSATSRATRSRLGTTQAGAVARAASS
jgi:hypothetical protein